MEKEVIVAKEQNFTKAAEQLHITQPILSRQMAAFEEELGEALFIRNGKKDVAEGTITIGCGEFAAVETLARGYSCTAKNFS